jgi:hypothetical protein
MDPYETNTRKGIQPMKWQLLAMLVVGILGAEIISSCLGGIFSP